MDICRKIDLILNEGVTLTDGDMLVLKDIYEHSHITKGKTKGKLKNLFSYERANVYNAKGNKSLQKLQDQGYVVWKSNTIYGDGFQLTQKGLDQFK